MSELCYLCIFTKPSFIHLKKQEQYYLILGKSKAEGPEHSKCSKKVPATIIVHSTYS